MTEGLPHDVADAIRRYHDRLGMFGRALTWHAEVGSTNDVAARLAERGAVEGTVVGADAQMGGRGRLGRAWSSPPAAGLYVSTILRPGEHVVRLLTIAAGVSIAEGIREATGLTVDLKWPNDACIGGRKVAGILAEGGTSERGLSHVVLGIGINVMRAAHPPEVAARATSLDVELGRTVDRGLVLAGCLAALAVRYRQLTADARPVIGAWRAFAATTLGRRVECTVGMRSIIGVADDVDEQGALIVRTGSGTVRVISGEVIWQ